MGKRKKKSQGFGKEFTGPPVVLRPNDVVYRRFREKGLRYRDQDVEYSVIRVRHFQEIGERELQELEHYVQAPDRVSADVMYAFDGSEGVRTWNGEACLVCEVDFLRPPASAE